MGKLAKKLNKELKKHSSKSLKDTIMLLDDLESQGILKKPSYDILHIGMYPCDENTAD